jgi:hypothetical protein
VASFSTPSERDALIDCFSKDVLPEDIRTDRMNRVFWLMKKFPPIFCPLPLFVRPNIGIRLDLRYVMIFAEPNNLSGLNGFAGISFFF